MQNQKLTRILYERLSELVESGRLKNTRVVLFGVNAPAYKSYVFLTSRQIPIHAVIDNRKYESGEIFCGLPVQSPEAVLLPYQSDILVLIGSQYFNQMAAQLRGMGYSDKHIVCTIAMPAVNARLSGFLSWAWSYIRGKSHKNRLLKAHGDAASLILIPYAAIGDAYVLGSYLPAYLRGQGLDTCVFVVVGQACRRTMALFGFDPVEVVTQEQMDDLMTVGRLQGFGASKMVCLTHNLVHTDVLVRFERAGRLRWGYMVRRILLGLPEDSRPAEPQNRVDQKVIDAFFREQALTPGSTVVLSPYANTVMGLDFNFWDMLTDKLITAGYSVCTNSGHPENEPPLKNTKPVFFPVEHARAIIEQAGVFIGLRSGLCDIIALAQATKVVLYPDEDSLFFSLRDCGFHNGITELVCNRSPAELCDLVMEKVYGEKGNYIRNR